jgi:hypothetical protein
MAWYLVKYSFTFTFRCLYNKVREEEYVKFTRKLAACLSLTYLLPDLENPINNYFYIQHF